MSENAKHKAVYAAIALTTLPFFLMVSFPKWGLDTTSLRSTASYLASSFGYIGVALIIWELILGTRSISGLFFKDLVSKLKLHKTLGTYGVVFVFLHPLLVIYSYGESFLYAANPNLNSHFEQHVTFGRVALILMFVIWVTSALIRGKIAYRPWKYIHYLSYPILLLVLLHAPAVGTSFSNRYVQLFWYNYVGIAIICSALRIRHLFGLGKVRFEVVAKRKVTPEVTLLKLKPLQKKLTVALGQYIYFQPTLLSEEHPFTVLDHSENDGTIMIAFKHFGSFTNKLKNINAGERVYIDGPYGTFTSQRLANPRKPVVYIAGGIGITPFVQQSLQSSPESQFMFYANQTRHAAAFRDILKNHLRHRFVDIFSSEPPKHKSKERAVEYGFIDDNIIKRYLEHPHKYQYFICGPVGMIQAAREALLRLDVPHEHIHSEEFGF